MWWSRYDFNLLFNNKSCCRAYYNLGTRISQYTTLESHDSTVQADGTSDNVSYYFNLSGRGRFQLQNSVLMKFVNVGMHQQFLIILQRTLLLKWLNILIIRCVYCVHLIIKIFQEIEGPIELPFKSQFTNLKVPRDNVQISQCKRLVEQLGDRHAESASQESASSNHIITQISLHCCKCIQKCRKKEQCTLPTQALPCSGSKGLSQPHLLASQLFQAGAQADEGTPGAS